MFNALSSCDLAYTFMYWFGVGELLQPDDVTFSVLMRGYGEMNPPSWVLISGLLKMMEKQFQMKPSLGMLAGICSMHISAHTD